MEFVVLACAFSSSCSPSLAMLRSRLNVRNLSPRGEG
jgi:hypothetical protein